MPDEVNSSSGLGSRPRDRFVQVSLDKKIRTIGIDADAREIRLIANPPEPAVEFHQIKVGAEKPGNNNDAGGVTVRYPQSVVDGSGMQQENLSCE